MRTEAAKALAILARQPKNRPEIAQDDCLPLLVPSLLTGDEAFKEHAMHVLAEIAEPEANKMRIVHEGLLGPIMATSPRRARCSSTRCRRSRGCARCW